jgi:hypothetical protein
MKIKIHSAGACCPFCGGTGRYRMAKSRRWRPLFIARAYSCRICHSQYIHLPGLCSLLIEQGFKSFYIPASEEEAASCSGVWK